jgi:TolA-binding protein
LRQRLSRFSEDAYSPIPSPDGAGPSQGVLSANNVNASLPPFLQPFLQPIVDELHQIRLQNETLQRNQEDMVNVTVQMQEEMEGHQNTNEARFDELETRVDEMENDWSVVEGALLQRIDDGLEGGRLPP